jgi:hypothetical protein
LSRYAADSPHPLPEPFIADNWEDAQMYAPLKTASFDKKWTRMVQNDLPFDLYREWLPYWMKADTPEASFAVKFEGSMIGFFDAGGPEAGQLSVTIDGERVELKQIRDSHFAVQAGKGNPVNRFNVHCNNRHRGQYVVIDLAPGKHEVVFTLSPQIPDKARILGDEQSEDIVRNPGQYNQTVIYTGTILLRGKLYH